MKIAWHDRQETGPWVPALVWAGGVTSLFMALFTYWFAVADRYVIFLYEHNMGLDTTPFSPTTASRYWMAALVANGFVTLAYTALIVLLGRLRPRFRPPPWWQIWVGAAPMLLVAIPALTMTVNNPVLPLAHVLRVTSAALAGLALALLPGQLAGRQPRALFLLLLDGLALMGLLVALASLPYVIAHPTLPMLFMGGVLVGPGVAVLLLATAFYARRDWSPPQAATLFLAGCWVTYLLLPTVHYLLGGEGMPGSPRYHYISDAANFFAGSVPGQIGVWVVVMAIAWAVTRLRFFLRQGRR